MSHTTGGASGANDNPALPALAAELQVHARAQQAQAESQLRYSVVALQRFTHAVDALDQCRDFVRRCHQAMALDDIDAMVAARDRLAVELTQMSHTAKRGALTLVHAAPTAR